MKKRKRMENLLSDSDSDSDSDSLSSDEDKVKYKKPKKKPNVIGKEARPIQEQSIVSFNLSEFLKEERER